MKILLIIVLLITFCISLGYYIKTSKNIFLEKKTSIITSVVLLSSIILAFNLIIPNILGTLLLFLVLATPMYYLEQARIEGKNTFDEYGVAIEYEVPIKWIRGAIKQNSILYNKEDDKIDFVSELPMMFSNKYQYLATFKSGRKKLIPKNTRMHEEIKLKM